MKKILLTLLVASAGFSGTAQVVCSGVSPAAIQGNYLFGVQTHLNWPRYDGFGGAASENWNLTLDFSVPGTFIMDTLILVDDGTPGTNATYGNLLSEEGCNASPANAYNGKIAVLRRNTCDFASKAKHAQDAGALAVIIVDREDNENRENNYLSADAAGEGPNVTIPVIMINNSEGNNIINTMATEDVVMFIGNKLEAFPNDIGTTKDYVKIAPFAATSNLVDVDFTLGIGVMNFGSADQTNVVVKASIDGPSGNVYLDSVVIPSMASGDTAYVYPGEAYELPSAGNYPAGEYTLTYSIYNGDVDAFDFDNEYSNTYKINTNVISLAPTNAAGQPLANSFPSGADKPADYQSCMFFQDENASDMTVTGITIVPYADTALYDLEGVEIFATLYTWNDAWTDLNDATYFGATAAANAAFTSLNPVAFESYTPTSNDETGLAATIPLSTAYTLADNQRYLVCAQSYDTTVVFGYSTDLNYDGNQLFSAMPVSPVKALDNTGGETWFVGGWSSVSAPSIALNVINSAFAGLNDEAIVNGKAYPNPANNNVTIALEATGNGALSITDISGKTVLNQNITLVNGKSSVNIESLENGLYIFNIVLENGQTSQFNVVKN